MKLQLASPRFFAYLALSAFLSSHIACGTSDDESSSGRKDTFDDDNNSFGASQGLADGSELGLSSGDGDGGGGGGASPEPIRDELPPEIENKPNYRAPVVTGDYLWSANPESGRIAAIEGSTLQVEIISGGLQPTYMAGLPNAEERARVLVINVGSNEASLLRIEGEAGNAKIGQQRVAIHERANRWSVGSEGAYAIAFSQIEDAALPENDGLQEVTVLSLPAPSQAAAPIATRISVGYRPSSVVISENDQRAVVVAEDGITLIRLPLEKSEQPTVTEFIPLVDDSDVSVSPDARYVMVRLPDSTEIELYDLNRPAESVKLPVVIPFPAVVTDLDLAPNGRGVAVLRARDTLGTFILDELLLDPSAIDFLDLEGEAVGSAVLSGNGERTVLYQTAEESNDVVIVDLSKESFLSYRTLSLIEPVRNVEVSEDGNYAIALTYLFENQPSSFAAFSLGNEPRFPRIVGTFAPIKNISISKNNALITTTSSSINEAFFIQLPSLATSSTLLSAPPLASGILSNIQKGFVAQQHPSGRLSFCELETAKAQTLSGYELSADVVNK